MAVGMGQRALGVVASAINGAAGEYVRERQKRGDMRRKMALANYQKRLDGLDKSMEAQTQAGVDREFPKPEVPPGYYIGGDGQLVNREAELMRQRNSPPGVQGDPSGGGLGRPGYGSGPGISFGGGPISIADRNREQELGVIRNRLNALLDDVQFGRMDVDEALNEAAKIGALGDGKLHPNYKSIAARLKDIKRDREKDNGEVNISKGAGDSAPADSVAVPTYNSVGSYNPQPDPSNYQGQFVREERMGAGGDVTAQQDTGMRDKMAASPDDEKAAILYNENFQFRREVERFQNDYKMSLNDAIRAAAASRQQRQSTQQQAQPAQRAQ